MKSLFPGDDNGTLIVKMGKELFNGQMPDIMSNGYLVFKVKGKDDLILLLDPVTGIVRDVMTVVCGAYCYHNIIRSLTVGLNWLRI